MEIIYKIKRYFRGLNTPLLVKFLTGTNIFLYPYIFGLSGLLGILFWAASILLFLTSFVHALIMSDHHYRVLLFGFNTKHLKTNNGSYWYYIDKKESRMFFLKNKFFTFTSDGYKDIYTSTTTEDVSKYLNDKVKGINDDGNPSYINYLEEELTTLKDQL